MSLFFVTMIGASTSYIKFAKYNENKLRATRYAEEIMEWVKGEKEENWLDFVNNRTSATPGTTWCFNTQTSYSPVIDDFNDGDYNGWLLNCGGNPSASIVPDSYEGPHAFNITSTGGDGLACAYKTNFSANSGMRIVFYAKGNGTPDMCLWNGSECINNRYGALENLGPAGNGFTKYRTTASGTQTVNLHIYSHDVNNNVTYDFIAIENSSIGWPAESGSCEDYSLGGLFKREVVLVNQDASNTQVNITATVYWLEGGEEKQVRLNSIFTVPE